MRCCRCPQSCSVGPCGAAPEAGHPSVFPTAPPASTPPPDRRRRPEDPGLLTGASQPASLPASRGNRTPCASRSRAARGILTSHFHQFNTELIYQPSRGGRGGRGGGEDGQLGHGERRELPGPPRKAAAGRTGSGSCAKRRFGPSSSLGKGLSKLGLIGRQVRLAGR